MVLRRCTTSISAEKHRTFAVSFTEAGWRYWNQDPSFAQRFTGTFGDHDVIIGRADRSQDDGHTWELDLEITYRRVPGPGDRRHGPVAAV